MKKFEIKKFSLASVLASLAAVIVIMGGMFEVLDLTVSAIASFAVVIAVIELRGKYPYFVFLVAAVLAMIFMPMRSASVYFVFFLGYYPILKAALAKVNRVIAWIVKLSAFNTALLVLYFFFRAALGLPAETLPVMLLLAVAGNVFFVAYDFALSGMITYYIVKLRKSLKMKDMF